MEKLNGKVAIVTGGARGMGSATTELFAREGARVVIVDVLDEEGTVLAEGLGDSVTYHHLDVSDEEGWNALGKAVTEKHGRIDILVNNAAVFINALIEETESDAFRWLLDINLVGPYLGMKTVIPYMKKQGNGAIINVSSIDGLRGSCGGGAYNASKWGLRGLTKAIAMEAGPFGIRVNSIHPGAVDTPMLNPGRKPPSKLHHLFPGVSLSRVGDPMEIAAANLFLASDDASYISGAELAVDGGWTAGVYLGSKPGP